MIDTLPTAASGYADVRAKLTSMKSDVAQLTTAKRRASLLGSGGSGPLNAQDFVERLFSTSKNGVVYLQSGLFSPEAVALLKSPGPKFSVAGKIELQSKMDSDHGILVEFSVPARQAMQYKHCNANTDMHDFLPDPRPFTAAPFCTLLTLEQAERMLMTIAAPAWPAIN